jgi:hypothetical protein
VSEQRLSRELEKAYREWMGKLAWIAGAVLLWAGAARAEDTLTRVEALLSAGIEPSGAHDAIVALGAEGERALWTLYGDANTTRVVRLRALSELARFASVQTAQGFAGLIRAARGQPSLDPLHPARSPVVLRRALDGLAAIAAQVAPGIDASELGFALNHQDAHVRRAATELLALLDAGDVDAAISQRLVRDPSRMVRATAQRAQRARASRARR